MVILHYFLGFPPYRTGGLTRYAIDLMTAQLKDGHHVCALWPGRIGVLNKKLKIRKSKYSQNNIESFEIVNPLPVPLDEGIKEIDAFIRSCNKSIYEDFLSMINPDVIHIHSLMGIHKEFFSVANNMRIKTIYTTHDYFGLCPRVTFYRNGDVCDGVNFGMCDECNKQALSLSKIVLMQSHVYMNLKDSKIVKTLRKKHRAKYFEEPVTNSHVRNNCGNGEKYETLRNFYKSILENIDLIHFNSSISKKVFCKFIKPKKSIVLPITHSNVIDNRSKRNHKRDEILKIAYLSPTKPFKGFSVLKKALDEICEKQLMNVELRVFAPVNNPTSYMIIKENGYSHSELQKIMDEVDIVVAPSIWYETFGFTVLEALSYGVPVIVSNRVGAKDVVKDGGMIVQAGSTQALLDAIVSLSKDSLHTYETNIQNNVFIKSWDEFVDENYQLYLT